MRASLALLVAAVVALVWNLFSAHRAAARLKQDTEAQAVVIVATTQPRPQADASDLVLPGSMQANYDAPIYARTNGYLKRWLVDIGTQVKAGQVLGEIESPEVDQQLRQGQADVATAEANQKIAGVTAERWRNLRATDSVSKQEADEKISLAASTDAQVQAAKANVQRLRELDMAKPPGVAETIDWVRTLGVLGETELTLDAAGDTLGAVVKDRDDMDLVRDNLAEIISGG